MPCRGPLSPRGISPSCHLGDGCLDLILGEQTSRLHYVSYLLQTLFGHEAAINRPFIKIVRAKEFTLVPRDDPRDHGVWNQDGEVIEQAQLHVKVHRQGAVLFGCGPYDGSCSTDSRDHVKTFVV